MKIYKRWISPSFRPITFEKVADRRIKELANDALSKEKR